VFISATEARNPIMQILCCILFTVFFVQVDLTFTIWWIFCLDSCGEKNVYGKECHNNGEVKIGKIIYAKQHQAAVVAASCVHIASASLRERCYGEASC